MGCLELSRAFFLQYAQPELEQKFPQWAPHVAAGLVGNGSECFGYDDEISKDHDWGIDFYLWVTEEKREAIPVLAAWKRNLLERHPEVERRQQSAYGAQVGVSTVDDYYRRLIGFPRGPETIAQWRAVPQENLAMAVNGAVFRDPAGQFTAVRAHLLEHHYPRDLRLKKIAAKCMAIAQTGQYNFDRCRKRRDWVTLRTVLARFQSETIALVFLLNRVFQPYYKWEFRRMTELPILGERIGSGLRELAERSGLNELELDRQKAVIMEICAQLKGELRRQGLSDSDDWFLASHGESVQSRIGDVRLRSLPAQFE